MVTSSAEGRDIAESYKLGVNSYVVKPVEFSQFSDTVAKAGLYWMVVNKAPH
jgi:response regulator of citrate/malate metabolism